jgi:DNA-binding response OmpR family regulator
MTLVPSSDVDEQSSVLILLAERDVYASELIEYMLRTEGYQVAIAADAADAMTVFAERRPDLVFVELLISGGVGVDLCRRLCDAGARVVAVSALALGAAAIEVGAEAFLRKPLEPLQVLSTVKDLVGTSSLTQRSTPITYQ